MTHANVPARLTAGGKNEQPPTDVVAQPGGASVMGDLVPARAIGRVFAQDRQKPCG
jgi:hypothetical protein